MRCRFLLISQPVFSLFDFKMLNHQQLLTLTLTILSLSRDVQAGKNKFDMKRHQAPEYASGPNGTMTKIDYINQFRSICDDLKVVNEANDAIHAQFEDLFETVVVSSEAINGSVDCTLSRIFKNDTTMFVPTDKDLQERVKEVKHCLVNEKDTELLKKFVTLYEAEYMLNAKVRIELFTAYGLKGLVLFKPVNKTYFNTSDPYTHFQYGCKIDDLKNNTDEMMVQYSSTYMLNESISGLHEANFTKEKKETFKDIQFYINNTYDALSDLIDYANPSYRSLKHPVPKFTSGPNQTMTKGDYNAYVSIIRDDIFDIEKANNSIHEHYRNFFNSMNISAEATSKDSFDCSLKSILGKYEVVYPVVIRNDIPPIVTIDNHTATIHTSPEQFQGKYCTTDQPLLFSYFLKFYEAWLKLDTLLSQELTSVFCHWILNRPYFFGTRIMLRQYGECLYLKNKFSSGSSKSTMEKLETLKNPFFEGIKVEKFSNLTQEEFTKLKIQKFTQIFLSINQTYDALADLEDYKPSMESKKTYVSNGAKFHDEPGKKKPRLAKMEMISENPLPFNPLLILLGSVTALVIVSATIALVLCLKKSKKNETFRRLKEEDPEGNENNTNPTHPANAVKWSLENDQLTLITK